MSTTSAIVLKELYPTVEASLKDKKNREAIKKIVNEYVDRNNEKLTTLGPIYRTIFSTEDRERLYNILNITSQQIKDTVKKSTYIKSSWKKVGDPFFIASILAIRYAVLNKDDTLRVALITYFMLALYPSLHFKYFQYEPNENIMSYTLNSLSKKYKIRQLGTIYNTLLDTVLVSHKNEEKDLIKGNDKAFVDYVNSSQTRINSLLKNISREYYKDHKRQNYLNLEEDKVTEDEFKLADSSIFSIEKVTNKVVLKLLTEGPSIRIIDFSARICSVSSNELRNYINTMVTGKYKEDIRTLIENIVFLYLFDGKNTIQEVSSNKFTLYCLELYKKSNTSNKNILEIKKILDKWLKDIDIYKKTQRLATINDFRRAIYLFFVFSISKVSGD